MLTLALSPPCRIRGLGLGGPGPLQKDFFVWEQHKILPRNGTGRDPGVHPALLQANKGLWGIQQVWDLFPEPKRDGNNLKHL